MIIWALFKKNNLPSTNLVGWVNNELSILQEKATNGNDLVAKTAAELGQWYCKGFILLNEVEPDQNTPYHSMDLSEWKLDYQQRAFALFDFIRDRFRDETKIDIEKWVEIDKKHTDAGYFDRYKHFVEMLVLAKKLENQLEEILNATD